MKIDSIRIYSEVLEQGLNFKYYFQKSGYNVKIQNVYTKKDRHIFSEKDSLIDRIRKVKDVDILISVISQDKEYPFFMIEYSTAVPTDDHKMQRSDVYYWAAELKVPIMKISPSSKGMSMDFGGGAKFNDDIERVVAYNRGALLFPIEWKNIEKKDILQTSEDEISCINYSDEIEVIINKLLSILTLSSSYDEYYVSVYNNYTKRYSNALTKYSKNQLCDIIVNSSRFIKENGKICVKINRFGHAMDPDRGVLYFVNMLVGVENTITEIQINRSANYNNRGGYKSLFDAISRENLLKDYVTNIIKNKNNKFSEEDAVYIFLQALNIDNNLQLKKIKDKEYFIDDNILCKFLTEYSGIATKSIFFLSSELRLTDADRNLICKIQWNTSPIKMFLDSVKVRNYTPVNIKELENKEAKEDIVTYTSVLLYRKIKTKIIAVSYPGAQGDRCILTGEGRNVLRTYIDIIACKESDMGLTVYLEECKDKIRKSSSDVIKLNKICSEPDYINGMKHLFKKIINRNDIKQIYKSIGSLYSSKIPYSDVDYIFMFNIRNTETKTLVDYKIGIINTDLLSDFIKLSLDKKRLTGTIELDKIYTCV